MKKYFFVMVLSLTINSAIPLLAEDLRFETIVKDNFCGLTRPLRKVIATPADWKKLWKDCYSSHFPFPGLPSVDFTSNVVVVVALGEKPSGGYDVEITRIENKSKFTLIHYKEINTSAHDAVTLALTQPFHIVTAEKPTSKIKFVKD